MPDIPHQLLEPIQAQLRFLEQLFERERQLQREVTDHVIAPFDAVFDLLEQSGGSLRRQAEALAAAGRALEESARLVEAQAELFERTVGALRQPLELVRGSRDQPEARAPRPSRKKS